MDDRRHLWHDPGSPPPEIIEQNRMQSPPGAKQAKKTLLIVFAVLLGLGLFAIVLIFGSAVIAGVLDGWNDPIMPVVTEKEETGVRGLATKISDLGRRQDYDAIVALGDGSKSLDRSELSSDVAAAFGGFTISDWAVDAENVQVLADQQTKERIVVFRIKLTGTDGSERTTSPFYAVETDGVWRLTGLRGREVREVLY